MGKTPRKYKGARTPQSLKEVRASARRNAVQQPQRTVAKSLVARAHEIISGQKEGDATTAVSAAASALDRAAKKGAIHKNAAARRKSRLAKKASKAVANPGAATAQASAPRPKAGAKKAPVKKAPAKAAATGAAAKGAAKTAAKKDAKAK